ncbi:MAG: hypothetical protein R2941_12505 [Desulfobacterales bacterium]
MQILSAFLLFGGFVFFCTLLYVYQGTVFSMGYNLAAGICGYVILSFSAYSREKNFCVAKDGKGRLKKAAGG